MNHEHLHPDIIAAVLKARSRPDPNPQVDVLREAIRQEARMVLSCKNLMEHLAGGAFGPIAIHAGMSFGEAASFQEGRRNVLFEIHKLAAEPQEAHDGG